MIPIIIYVNNSFNARKWKNISSPQKQHDNDDPHMKSPPQFSLQSFSFIPTNGMINTILHNSKPFFPTLTRLEKEKGCFIYSQTSQEGGMPDWRRDYRWWRVKPSLIWWWTNSNWTRTANQNDTSLSELAHPPNNFQIDAHVWRR